MEPDRTSQPLSTVAAISLAGLTAAAVFGGGVFIVQRSAAPRPSAPAPATVSPAPPSAGAAPSAVEVGEASSVPFLAKSAPMAEPAAAANLPPRFGYLTVHGQGEARVYVNGADLGPLNEVLKAPCGLKYVRLGTAGARPPSWLSPGQSVAIGCRAMTEISAP